jgi:hypothetical protein
VALGITIGIREQFALSGLFMLTWCCMAFGFLVEYHSMPKGDTDTINYAMRMVPHILGWFPMTSVWFWLIAQLETTKRDVAEVTDREIPTWVNALIYGTFLIFMCFAVVRSATLNTAATLADPTMAPNPVVAGPDRLPGARSQVLLGCAPPLAHSQTIALDAIFRWQEPRSATVSSRSRPSCTWVGSF